MPEPLESVQLGPVDALDGAPEAELAAAWAPSVKDCGMGIASGAGEHAALVGRTFAAVIPRLRNQAASILAAAEILHEAVSEGRGQSLARLIHHEATRLDEHLANLQVLASLPQIKPARVEIIGLLQRVVAEYCETSDDLHVSIAGVEQLPLYVWGDAEALSLVFHRLLRNAREAMPLGGRVEISVARGEDVVRLRFSDGGPGLPCVAPEVLFAPLFTTHTGALGLGLALCRGILQRLDGDITAENMPDGGACIALYLRAADGGSLRRLRQT